METAADAFRDFGNIVNSFDIKRDVVAGLKERQFSGINVSLGGTTMLILVGVALETVRSLESQMMMRHHKGFLE